MKLAYPVLNKSIDFSENNVNVLIIENAHELRRLISCVKSQIEGCDGELVLSETGTILELCKAAVLVTDPFSLDFSSRKVLAKINQEACNTASVYSEEFQVIMNNINALALTLGNSLGFEVSFDALEDYEEIIKLMGFHIDAEALSFPEQVLEYISLYRNLLKKSLFVFYNLKACFSEEELSLFYKCALYRKLNILLIEDCQRKVIEEYENIIIVDKDLCII